MANDQTTLTESAQALFCAMADYIGASKVDKIFDEEKYPTYDSFKKFWNKTYPTTKIENSFKSHVDANSDLKTIENFLNDNNDWYISSLKIAKKLIQDIDKISIKFNSIKRPSWSSIFYVRGDKEIMNNIELLFNEANEVQKRLQTKGAKSKVNFGDINKWSPADIYLASPKAKKQISNMVKNKKGLTFSNLNIFIFDMIQSGDLLPLSLKKQTREVKIEKINFNKPEELKKIRLLKYHGKNDWKPRSKQLNSLKPSSRDLKIYVSQDKKDYIQFEHGATGGAFKIIYFAKDMDARGGALSSPKIFIDLTFLVDKQKTLSGWLQKYNTANKNFKEMDKKLLNGKPKPSKDTAEGKEYRKKRGDLSGTQVTDVVIPDIIKYFDNEDLANKTIQLLYQYITSRLDNSAAFVIAK
jgi:hypothetical protein